MKEKLNIKIKRVIDQTAEIIKKISGYISEFVNKERSIAKISTGFILLLVFGFGFDVKGSCNLPGNMFHCSWGYDAPSADEVKKMIPKLDDRGSGKDGKI